ncbi:MAG: hypothetical protein ACI8WB_004401 [Phenylobacterium sp.]|jgi:hypothetical protein
MDWTQQSTMDESYIEQNNIVAKYLRGQLTPEETVVFEEYLMDKPALIEQLEMESTLFRTMPQAVKSIDKQPAKKFWWFATPWWAGWASFATLLICVLSYPLIHSILDGESDLPDAVVMVNLQHIYLSPVRGAVNDADNVPVVTPLSSDRYFEITVQTANSSAVAFEVEIKNRKTEASLLAAQVIQLMDSGDIKLTLLSKVYPPGEYILLAAPVDGKSGPETFYFNVQHQ